MKRIVIKKRITVSDYVKRSLIQSAIFFYFLMMWQMGAFIQNMQHEKYGNPVYLLFLCISLGLFFSIYFEIITITDKEERFLGYKAYILNLYKLVAIPLMALTQVAVCLFTDSIFVFIFLEGLWFVLYGILLGCFMKKYKSMIQSKSGTIYICYDIKVKKWYKEGIVTSQNDNTNENDSNKEI